MTKKVYLLTFLLLFAVVGLFAQTVKIGTVTSKAGEVRVPVEMTGFTQPIGSMTFYISANKELLTFKGIDNVEGPNKAYFVTHQTNTQVNIVYTDMAGFTANGHVFDLVFDFTGTANAPLVLLSSTSEVTGKDAKAISFTAVNGAVNTDGTTPPVPPVIQLGTVTAGPGEVLVPVSFNHFTQTINSFTLKVRIPVNAVSYISIANIDPSLQGGTFTAAQAGDIININYSNVTGFTTSGKLFDIKLNYVGGFSVPLTFATGNEVTTAATPISNVSYVSGGINADTPVGTITIGQATGITGSDVLVPVTFEGTGLGSVGSFTIIANYDPTKLAFQGIEGSNLGDNLKVSGTGGTLVIAYTNTTPQNFNNLNLGNLKFTYLGVSPANISIQPGSEVTDGAGAKLPVSFVSGTVIPSDSESYFKIADVPAYPGAEVDVPITATKIGEVGSIQMVIRFDATKLVPLGVTAPNLNNVAWVVNPNNQGEIRLAWQSTAGATVADGVIATMKFKYLGGGTATLSFVESEVTGLDAKAKDVAFINGSVSATQGTQQIIIGNTADCENNIARLPLTFAGIEDAIGAFNLTLLYDPNVMIFQTIANPIDDRLIWAVETPGVLNIGWNGAGAATLTGADTLGILVFDYTGGQTAITVGAGSEVVNPAVQPLPITFVTGNVTCGSEDRTLTVTKTGEGTVQVKNGDTVLTPNLGATETYTVKYGTVLTLIATPAEGYIFENWTGNVTNATNDTTTINMTGDFTVTANFKAIPKATFAITSIKDTLYQGQTTTVDWTLKNDGKADLTYKVVADTTADWLTTNVTTGTLKPGESGTIVVTIDATDLTPGDYTGNLILVTNDPLNDTIFVPVAINVKAEPCVVPTDLKATFQSTPGADGKGNIVTLTWTAPANAPNAPLYYNLYKNNVLFVDSIKDVKYVYNEPVKGEYSYSVAAVYAYCGETAKTDTVKVNVPTPTTQATLDMIKMYPNPASTMVNIQISADLNVDQFIVYNFVGQVIETRKANPGQNQLDVRSYKAGPYIIKFITRKGDMFTQRLIVNN